MPETCEASLDDPLARDLTCDRASGHPDGYHHAPETDEWWWMSVSGYVSDTRQPSGVVNWPSAGKAACRDRDAGRPCVKCGHEACGWCDECHPEVPEW